MADNFNRFDIVIIDKNMYLGFDCRLRSPVGGSNLMLFDLHVAHLWITRSPMRRAPDLHRLALCRPERAH
jgi:hypothetical protein